MAFIRLFSEKAAASVALIKVNTMDVGELIAIRVGGAGAATLYLEKAEAPEVARKILAECGDPLPTVSTSEATAELAQYLKNAIDAINRHENAEGRGNAILWNYFDVEGAELLLQKMVK